MNAINQYNPYKFYIPTFIVTWGSWFLSKGLLQEDAGIAFVICIILGLCAPCLTAICLITFSKSRELKSIFYNKLVNLKLIKASSLPAIILIPPVSMIIAILISMAFGYSAQQFSLALSFSFKIAMFSPFLVLFLAAVLEELGWRGYAIESLNSKFNYFVATAIFSILWALWHLPLFFIEGSYQYHILQLNPLYALNFMVGIIPLAFIISWIYKINRANIFAAILFHFVINISQEMFKVEYFTKGIQTGVLMVIAAVIVYTQRDEFFNTRVIKSSPALPF